MWRCTWMCGAWLAPVVSASQRSSVSKCRCVTVASCCRAAETRSSAAPSRWTLRTSSRASRISRCCGAKSAPARDILSPRSNAAVIIMVLLPGAPPDVQSPYRDERDPGSQLWVRSLPPACRYRVTMTNVLGWGRGCCFLMVSPILRGKPASPKYPKRSISITRLPVFGERRERRVVAATVSAGREAIADGVFGQFGDTVQVELAHDIAAMDFDRRRREVQLLGDFRRGVPLGDQLQHLLLARSQARPRRVAHRPGHQGT